MAKANSYLDRQRQQTQAYIQATCDIYCQYICDMACITLHDDFGFGPERIKRFVESLGDCARTFDPALGCRTKQDVLEGQTEYLREKLDQKLRDAMGKYYDTDFDDRYPAVEKVRFKWARL